MKKQGTPKQGTPSPKRGGKGPAGSPQAKRSPGSPATPNQRKDASKKSNNSNNNSPAGSGLKRQSTPQRGLKKSGSGYGKEQSRRKISLRRSESREASFHSQAPSSDVTDWGEAVKFNEERGSLEFRLDCLQLVDADIQRFVGWFRDNITQIQLWYQAQQQQFGPKTKTGKPKQKTVANLYLQENRITDVGIKTLFDFLAAFTPHSSEEPDSKEKSTGEESSAKPLVFRRFFLFRNFISDEGASRVAQFIQESRTPIYEIHLSHNRISTEGALKIFKAVKESKLYPRGTTNPLWLRLEYNYISNDQAIEELKAMNIPYCPAVDRKVCSSGKCCLFSDKENSMKPLLHLYVFDMQYKMVEQSVRLQNAKKAVEDARKQKRTTSKVNVNTATARTPVKVRKVGGDGDALQSDLQFNQTEPMESERKGDSAGVLIQDISVPTYLFLDTNAVIWMISGAPNDQNGEGKKKANGGKEEKKTGGWSGKLFTFQNLVAKAKRNQFGECFDSEVDRVCLVITDTVMQELDHLKFSNPKLARKITKLQSDTGFLAECTQLHFLEMLGAHQGEHLVALTGQIVAGASDVGLSAQPSSLRNDRRIIDVALLWNGEIGVTGSVIFVTNDRGAMETAKRHNLPAVCVDEIDKNLRNMETNMSWTASVLKRCMPQAATYAGRSISATPVKPVRSVYSEIEAAIDLVQRLTEQIKQQKEKEKEGESSEALFSEVDEAVERWKALLESQQVGPYSAQKKKVWAAPGGGGEAYIEAESLRENLLEKFEEVSNDDGIKKKKKRGKKKNKALPTQKGVIVQEQEVKVAVEVLTLVEENKQEEGGGKDIVCESVVQVEASTKEDGEKQEKVEEGGKKDERVKEEQLAEKQEIQQI